MAGETATGSAAPVPFLARGGARWQHADEIISVSEAFHPHGDSLFVFSPQYIDLCCAHEEASVFLKAEELVYVRWGFQGPRCSDSHAFSVLSVFQKLSQVEEGAEIGF